MTDIIHLLPDSIANQIAAGEVVQRPSSAVKELLENSIDAEATAVTLIVRESGKSLIQVIDNGSGMSETDARMSLERHATSKIRTAEDLFTIRTMGFRGEALASIAAVSQFEMRTRLRDRELGTQVIVEGSEVKKQEPIACETGTSISVRNLFYNIPARRNFLKSNPVELRHIIDEFFHVALAWPQVAFRMYQGDEKVYDLPPSKLSQRIVNLFGKSYQEQLAACAEETDRVRITGYVGRPEFARKTRGEQYLFVNNRFVRSNYINHAVMTAFEGLLPEGSYPFYVLFIELDPRHIDVNVHPTKTEIKFDDERAVYAVVSAAVRLALGKHNLMPALDFEADVNLFQKVSSSTSASERDVLLEEKFATGMQRSTLENWTRLFERSGSDSALMELRRDTPEPSRNVPGTVIEEVFQLFDRYLAASTPGGLLVADQQAAHERILFERFLRILKSGKGSSQQVLFPKAVHLPGGDFTLIREMMPELDQLGFRLEVFGSSDILVSGVPAGVGDAEEEGKLLEHLLEQFKHNQSRLELPLHDNLARSLATRAAMKPGRKLSKEEMRSLLQDLFRCSGPALAPDGRATFFIFDASKIAGHLS